MSSIVRSNVNEEFAYSEIVEAGKQRYIILKLLLRFAKLYDRIKAIFKINIKIVTGKINETKLCTGRYIRWKAISERGFGDRQLQWL